MDGLPYAEFEALLIMQNRLLNDLEPRMRRAGLSSSGFMALRLIAQHTQPRATPTTRARIAEHLGITPASVTSLIARMIDREWIKEQRIDDRSTGLLITPAGRNKIHAGMVAWEDAFETIDGALSASMKSQLVRVITKINTVDQHRRAADRREMVLKGFKKHDSRKIVIEVQQTAKASEIAREAELDQESAVYGVPLDGTPHPAIGND